MVKTKLENNTNELLDITHSNYSLLCYLRESSLNIDIKLNCNKLTTACFPDTSKILQDILPSIFDNRCFNYRKVSFREEVKDTEIPHLLEHILLTLLRDVALKEGYAKVIYKGFTNWDWTTEERGLFHITIEGDPIHQTYLVNTLNKSIVILNSILEVDNLEGRL